MGAAEIAGLMILATMCASVLMIIWSTFMRRR